MPIHDWTKVVAGNFHDFHLAWAMSIRNTLNDGILPAAYYALVEQRAEGPRPDALTLEAQRASDAPHFTCQGDGGVAIAERPPQVRFDEQLDDAAYYSMMAQHVAIFHANGDRVVGDVEIVSPGNKHSESAVHDFRLKYQEAMRRGGHFLSIDVLPPGRHDPLGMHRECWDGPEKSPCVVTQDEPIGFASYVASDLPHVDFERAGRNGFVPTMPLFLSKTHYVDLPLEATYLEAWRHVPNRWKKVLEAET